MAPQRHEKVRIFLAGALGVRSPATRQAQDKTQGRQKKEKGLRPAPALQCCSSRVALSQSTVGLLGWLLLAPPGAGARRNTTVTAARGTRIPLLDTPMIQHANTARLCPPVCPQRARARAVAGRRSASQLL
eukprot:scaffold1589_cov111-Isochrysis_galbana.AAC.11